jgi:hypothetical protein
MDMTKACRVDAASRSSPRAGGTVFAAAVHNQHHAAGGVQGLIWHSRQAELAGHPPAQAVVLFGDRYPSGRGTWTRSGPGVSTLYEGPARILVDLIAEELSAVVQPED